MLAVDVVVLDPKEIDVVLDKFDFLRRETIGKVGVVHHAQVLLWCHGTDDHKQISTRTKAGENVANVMKLHGEHSIFGTISSDPTSISMCQTDFLVDVLVVSVNSLHPLFPRHDGVFVSLMFLLVPLVPLLELGLVVWMVVLR